MYLPRLLVATLILVEEFGEYLLARLEADPAVSHFALQMQAAQTALRAFEGTRRSASLRVLKARALRDHADFRLDRVVQAFELALLSFVNKDRDSVEYRRFFPKGLKATTRVPLDEEVRLVRGIEAQLEQGGGPEDRDQWRTDLSAVRAAAEGAAQTFETLSLQYDAATRAERVSRDAWRLAYRKVYGELIQQFPMDRARVESYFMANGHAREEKVEPAAPTTQPAT